MVIVKIPPSKMFVTIFTLFGVAVWCSSQADNLHLNEKSFTFFERVVEVSCVFAEQSEIGGAGGGLTGEQVDTHTHRPDRTPGFTFPVSQRKSLIFRRENFLPELERL